MMITSLCNPLGGNEQGKLKVLLVPSSDSKYIQQCPASFERSPYLHDGSYYPNVYLKYPTRGNYKLGIAKPEI